MCTFVPYVVQIIFSFFTTIGTKETKGFTKGNPAYVHYEVSLFFIKICISPFIGFVSTDASLPISKHDYLSYLTL
jgi:hypothetical protein